jgi:hypothetical protein
VYLDLVQEEVFGSRQLLGEPLPLDICRLNDPAPRGLYLGEPGTNLRVEAAIRDGEPGHRACACHQRLVGVGDRAVNDHRLRFVILIQGVV